jgi:hypothetical protein
MMRATSVPGDRPDVVADAILRLLGRAATPIGPGGTR